MSSSGEPSSSSTYRRRALRSEGKGDLEVRETEEVEGDL